MELATEFNIFLREKKSTIFVAPMDVCLFADKGSKAEDILDWVQPDLFVVCDSKKIGKKHINGAPDLIIEVLSPSTARIDRLLKFNSYEKAGITEYWIVDPNNISVEVYRLKENRFKRMNVYEKDESVTTELFPELQIDLKKNFGE